MRASHSTVVLGALAALLSAGLVLASASSQADECADAAFDEPMLMFDDAEASEGFDMEAAFCMDCSTEAEPVQPPTPPHSQGHGSR